MPLLSFKPNSLLLFFLFLPVLGFSQFSKHKWKKPSFSTEVPTQFQNEDAVYLLNKETSFIDVSGAASSTRKTVFERILIQSERGIDAFARVYFNKPSGWKLTKLDARCVKPNNKTIDMDKDDFITLGFGDVNDNQGRSQQIRFDIPGVEVGDVVEITYALVKNDFIVGEDISLHKSIPVLDARYKLMIPKGLIVESRAYNGMGEPSVKTNLDRLNWEWTAQNLEGFGNQDFAIVHSSKPFSFWAARGYVMPSGKQVPFNENNWNSFFEVYENAFSNKGFELSSTTGKFGQLIADAKNEPDAITRMEFMMDALMDLELVTDDLVYQEFDSYLNEGKIDYWTVHYYIIQAIEQLGLKGYVVFARDRYEGIIDLEFTSRHQIRYVYYAFKDESGNVNFVCPPFEGRFWNVNEYPWELIGADVILLPLKGKRGFVESAYTVSMPKDNPGTSFIKDEANLKVNLEGKEYSCNLERTLSGFVSTSFRPAYDRWLSRGELDKLDLFSEVDSIKGDMSQTSSSYPYPTSYDFELTGVLEVEELEENIISIPLGQFISQSLTQSSDSLKRTLDYHTPFPYAHETKMGLRFESPIALIEPFQLFSKTKYGSIVTELKQLTDNELQLNLRCNISAWKVSAEEYPEIGKLYDELEVLKNKEILLELNP